MLVSALLVSAYNNSYNQDQVFIQCFYEPKDLFDNIIIEITTVAAVFMFSLIFSTLFVSNCVYKTMVNDFVEKYNFNTLLYEYDPYFYKFLDEYDLLKMQELSSTYLNSLGNKYIKESTPCGIVILTYNNEYNSFDYYCKKSNSIGFNYLEVVSRIYVVNFDCKTIYSDNYDNLIKLYNIKYGITNEDDLNLKNLDQEKSDTVFFTKKTYSSNSSNSSNFSKKSNAYNFVSNKYKYKGSLDDFYNYSKNNNFSICYSNTIKDVSENYSIDMSSCFFSLESKTQLDDAMKVISFKTFKALGNKK
jgi:hypothetical protein